MGTIDLADRSMISLLSEGIDNIQNGLKIKSFQHGVLSITIPKLADSNGTIKTTNNTIIVDISPLENIEKSVLIVNNGLSAIAIDGSNIVGYVTGVIQSKTRFMVRVGGIVNSDEVTVELPYFLIEFI